MPLVATAATELIQRKENAAFISWFDLWMFYMAPFHAVKQQQLHLHEAERDRLFITSLRNVTFSRLINYI